MVYRVGLLLSLAVAGISPVLAGNPLGIQNFDPSTKQRRLRRCMPRHLLKPIQLDLLKPILRTERHFDRMLDWLREQ